MGKPRVIAETGAGQHGVATATASALFGLKCVVYMGEEDIRRQSLTSSKCGMWGPSRPVQWQRTLRDAVNEAMRDWMASVEHTHYILGSVVGHTVSGMVRDFQSVIGRETIAAVPRADRPAARRCRRLRRRRQQLGRHVLPLCRAREVELVGVEAGGRRITAGDHAATLSLRRTRRAARHLSAT